VRRREFITLLGGASAWPLAARAQQDERMRRIGVLTGSGGADDPDVKERYAALVQRLQQLGWSEGRNLRIEAHWTASEPDDLRKRAAELVALAPDVIVAGGTSTVGPLLQATRTVPIVFAGTADPVGSWRPCQSQGPSRAEISPGRRRRCASTRSPGWSERNRTAAAPGYRRSRC
jgi:putative ABC transport system substrate-binding protein